jgi:hypothetical protein
MSNCGTENIQVAVGSPGVDIQFRRPEQRNRNDDWLPAARSEAQTPVGARFLGPIQTGSEPQPPVQRIMGIFPEG